MARRFNCSSSSSYDDDDDDGTAMTDSTSGTYDGNKNNKNSRLFQEAEEMFNKGLESLFAVGHMSCGLDQFQPNCDGNGGSRGGLAVDPDEGIKPDWRKDPYHSMSDWTLIVRDGSTRQPQTYHIHKSVVSYGERKSGFFIRLFERDVIENGGRRVKKGGGVSEVALPRRAVQCIPQLLDFIYSDILDLNAQSAPSMRYLANTFDVRELYALVSSFIQSDISESTITIYIREAEAVKDKELLNLGMSLACSKFDIIPDDLLLELQPHVFQQLTSNPQLNCSSSERLSQRVAVYSRGRSEEMNDEVFYFMTHAQILPRICSSEAMWFLNFTASKFGNVLVDDSMGGYEGTLKRRCIVAAAQDWRNILVESIKLEVKRKVEGARSGGISSTDGGDIPRRRLFVDGDDETNIDKGRGYMSLPMDIRVELLEEALISAATIGVNNAGANEIHATQLVTEQRGDIVKRKTQRSRRERKQLV